MGYRLALVSTVRGKVAEGRYEGLNTFSKTILRVADTKEYSREHIAQAQLTKKGWAVQDQEVEHSYTAKQYREAFGGWVTVNWTKEVIRWQVINTAELGE